MMTPKRAAWPSHTCQRGGAPSVARSVKIPAHEQKQRRIGRQHVMRQLGRQQLADDPVGQVPGKQEGQPRIGAEAGQRRQPAFCGERAERPQEQRKGQQIVPRREAMRFLAGGDLAQHVLADGFLPERPAGFQRDGDDPGRDEQRGERDAAQRLQVAQPAAVAVDDDERADGEQAEQRNDRPLDQDGGGLGNPEQPGRVAGRRLACRGPAR